MTVQPIEWIRDGDCIIETRHAVGSSGYPMIRRNGYRTTIAHAILRRRLGNISSDVVSRHTCDNRRCINPHHIIAGSRAENSRDMVDRGRSTRGERNLHCKLTSDQVLLIRSDSRLHRLIANDYGITPSHVSEIKAKKTWKHI